MTLPEGLVGLAAVAVALASVRTPRPWLVAVVVVAALLVLTLGTPRWQLVPAGLAVGLLAMVTLAHAVGGPATTSRWVAAVVVAGVALSAVLAWALPVPRLALEPGSARVGTVAFDLVDPSRTSPSTRDGGPRVTPVQAWFPTDEGASGPPLRVTDEPTAFADAVGSFLGVPSLVLRHLGNVTSAAIDGAPPAGGRLPVVLSLHGWGGFRFAQAPLLEQLAADGHLVLAMDHTHGALASQPVAGGVIPLDPRLLPNGVPQPVYDEAARVLERTFADDAAALLAALRDASDQVPAEVLAAADLDRLVVLGHSTGGGAATLLCAEQPCDAMVLFDPWVEPVPAEVRAAGFAAPTYVVLSADWEGNDNDRLLRPMVAASDDARLVVLDGTTHNDVTVQARLSPLARRVGVAGSLPPERVDEVVTALTRSWVARTTGTGVGDPTLVDGPPFDDVRPG